VGRSRSALLLLAAAIALWWHLTPTSAQPSCQFVGDFATVRELVGPETVGDCLEDEHVNADGGTEQRTTGGTLTRRETDNVVVFTDGVTSWVNGPNGLQSRPNDERFGWESDPDPQPQTPPSADEASTDSQLLPGMPALFGVAPSQDPADGATATSAPAPAAPVSPTDAPTPMAAVAQGGAATPTRAATPGTSSAPMAPSAPGRTAPVGGQCPATHRIKGATSSKGEKLFYEPDRPEYAKVTPDICFTAGGDARDAGYVSAKR
jgi:hypothetical protein